jgi:hypothetical protein
MAAATSAASSQQPTVFPHSHVGFDSITSQIERKLLKRGFQFNVMCVGMYALVSQLQELWLTSPSSPCVQDKLASVNRLWSTPSSHPT